MEKFSDFWMVWREGDRGPGVKHETAGQANMEAARLAGQNPGEVFHVLKTVGLHLLDPDPINRVWEQYRHMDVVLNNKDLIGQCLFDIWQAVRESQKGKEGTGPCDQAKADKTRS